MLSILLLAGIAVIGFSFDFSAEDDPALEDDEDVEDEVVIGDQNQAGFFELGDADDAYQGDDTGAGSEIIHAGTGSEITGEDVDRVDGGLGNDTLTAGAGVADFHGGAGDDALDMSAAETYLAFGGDGDDLITGSDAATLQSQTQTDAGDGDDTVHSGDSGEFAFGNSGDDSLAGYDGDDWLAGGAGADYLDGGDGDDILDHNGSQEYSSQWDNHASPTYAGGLDGAADTLDGGAGDDILRFASGDVATGGDGDDLFEICATDTDDDTDTLFEPAVITDFESGDLVEIALPPESGDIASFSMSYAVNDDETDVIVNGSVVAILAGDHSGLTAGYSNGFGVDGAPRGDYITEDGSTIAHDPRIGNIDVRVYVAMDNPEAA